MLEIISFDVIAFIMGSVSLAVAMISLSKGQKLEDKLKEKDKLKGLSKKMDEIVPVIMDIIEEINEPEKIEDLFSSLQLLSQDIISKSFDDNKYVYVLDIKSTAKNDTNYEKLSIEIKDSVIKSFKENDEFKWSDITTECTFGNNVYYMSDFLFYNLHFIMKYIHDIENEFNEILFEFRPEILNNLENCLEKIIESIIDHLIDLNEIEVNVKSFGKTDEIGMWIYHQVVKNDELMPELNELIELNEEIKKFREILMTTSYS